MAVPEEVSRFVRQSLTKGCTRPQIEQVLLQAGWTTAHVKEVLALYAELDFPVPVPRPRPYLSAREAFLYLVLFTTLYISAFNFGNLVFQFIDWIFPDAAMQPERLVYSSHDSVRWSVSHLVVSFPIFLYVSRLTKRAIRLDPAKAFSKVRKWLTYLTLFVAAGVLIGDCVALVFHFLSGELGVRFGLKVLSVGAIAGAVFGYYLRDLRLEEQEADT
jgi:hypothetical protein